MEISFMMLKDFIVTRTAMRIFKRRAKKRVKNYYKFNQNTMSDKYKNDQIAIEEIKKVTGGVMADAYFHAESGYNFGPLTFLLGPVIGSLLSLAVGKDYLVALVKDHIYFIKTNSKCSKFKGEHIKIHKSDILEVEGRKNYKNHTFKFELRDGKKHKIEASEAFIHLEDRPGNIGKFERFLGIYHQ